LGTIDADTGAIKTAVEVIDNAIDGSEMQVDLVSANVTNTGTFAVQADLGATDNAVLDAIATSLAVLDDWDDSDYANVNMNLAGSDAQAGEGTISASTQRVTIATDDDGVAHLATIAGDTTSIQTAVELIDDAIFVDDAAFTLGSSKGVMMMGFAGTQAVNANDAAALACGTDGSLLTTHSVTGIVDGVKTVTNAGTDVALVAGSTACKKVDIQAQTDNTGVIAVGATGVDATVATGTGIILNAGDVYSMEIDDLVNIYIDSAVNGEGVRFTYFT